MKDFETTCFVSSRKPEFLCNVKEKEGVTDTAVLQQNVNQKLIQFRQSSQLQLWPIAARAAGGVEKGRKDKDSGKVQLIYILLDSPNKGAFMLCVYLFVF